MKIPSWIYDGSPIADPFGKGQAAVDWLRRLKHPKNPAPGHPFQLDEWQERIIRAIYGPCYTEDRFDARGNLIERKGERIVRRVCLLLPRGNRKTSLAAAITLLHLAGPERITGGLVMSAASARDQAKELYKEAALIVNHDKRLAQHMRVKKGISAIECAKASTEYRAISADGGGQHGKTPAVVIADELHVWKKQHRDLWEALDSALVKQPNTLMIVASTSGRGQENLAWEFVDYAIKVQDGIIDDPRTLPIIFMAEKEDDWRSEDLWFKLNPGMRFGYPDLAGFRDKAKKAEHSPSDRDGFLQFNLNTWLDKTTSGYVDMDVYDQGGQPIDRDALKGRPCYIAVDMSTTTDLTAVVAAFRDEDEGFTVLPHFFVPHDNLRDRAERDGVPYVRWHKEGHLTATPGNVIDYRIVGNYIRDLCELYQVREIDFDPAYAQPVMGPLNDDGYPVATMRQGWVTQSPALNVLERAIVSHTFRHGAHPVLRWCFENVAIHTDSAGNRTMHKGKSVDRIDGAVATWMAVSRAAADEDTRSIYTDVSARPEGLLFF